MDQYQCTKCKKTLDEDQFHMRPPQTRKGRPVQNWCKECRKTRPRRMEVFIREMKKHKGLCATCQKPRKILAGHHCRECLEAQGLKKCVRCDTLGLVLFDFMGTKDMCIQCWERLTPQLLKVKEAARISDLTPEEKIIDARMRLVYKSDLETYKRFLANQNGVCAICGIVADFHVDRDHKTGAIRGLLCRACNVGLGFFKDDPETLQKAIKYLLKDPAGCETSDRLSH